MISKISNNANIKADEMRDHKLDTPLISDKVYELLPEILKTECNQFSVKRERDMFLLGSLVLMSGSLQNVFGVYDRKKIYCPLYAMVIAPPASGKGVLVDSLRYVEKIQNYLTDKFRNEECLNKFNQERSNSSVNQLNITPKRIQKKLIIPANSSSAAFMKLLKNSSGEAIIFETEADSLSTTLKNDWGNYSDILRKAYHHEPITSSRIDDNADIDIKSPKLAVLISGTIDQVSSMKLDDPVNGLQSRFLYYFFESLPRFKDVSPYNRNVDLGLNNQVGDKLLRIYKFLGSEDYEVKLSRLQWDLFNRYFSELVPNLVVDYNNLYNSLLTRHAVSAFRLLMVITTLRAFEKNIPSSPIYCTKKDILTVYHLMETLIVHGSSVFHMGKETKKDEVMAKSMEFYKVLPSDKNFTRQEAIELGSQLFSSATIDRRLNKLKKSGHLISIVSGVYKKA
jgi:hypothetical protein